MRRRTRFPAAENTWISALDRGHLGYVVRERSLIEAEKPGLFPTIYLARIADRIGVLWVIDDMKHRSVD